MTLDNEPSNALHGLLTFRLSRLQARTNAQAARILKEKAGISLSEWRIFVMIETTGKTTPSQIVRLTGTDKGLVSRTVKGMQKKRLLTVETSETDQRSHVIDFTPTGFAVFNKARPAMRKRQDLIRQALDAEELDALFGAFDKLDAALDGMESKL